MCLLFQMSRAWEAGPLVPLVHSGAQKHSFRFLLQRRSSWTRAGDAEIALSLSLHARTKERIPLVCSKEGPRDGGVGGRMSNCACVSVERVSGGGWGLNFPYNE